MVNDDMLKKASCYMNTLCGINGGRRVGSNGNMEATKYVAGVMRSPGYAVDTSGFPCPGYKSGNVSLSCDGRSFEVQVSPLSP